MLTTGKKKEKTANQHQQSEIKAPATARQKDINRARAQRHLSHMLRWMTTTTTTNTHTHVCLF